jgi:hypothetical protein
MRTTMQGLVPSIFRSTAESRAFVALILLGGKIDDV